MSEWQVLPTLGGVRRMMGPDGVVQYETRPGETAREALQRGTIVALVVLCEELLQVADLSAGALIPIVHDRDVDNYRARLAELRGEE